MFIPWDYAQKQAAVREASQAGNSCTPSITVATADNFESHMVEYLKGEVPMRILLVSDGCMNFLFLLMSAEFILLICNIYRSALTSQTDF